MNAYPEFALYPSPSELEAWTEGLFAQADRTDFQAEILGRRGFSFEMGCYNMRTCSYVKFRTSLGREFYCYWDWVPGGPAPLAVHTPGYNSEMSAFHMLKTEGFNVLHVDPLGYLTPEGADLSKKKNGAWPVLSDYIGTYGESGYRDWLVNTIVAVRWALGQENTLPHRVSFFGTSQGGMGSLVLGSAFLGRGARCVCADLPYLQSLPMRDYDTGADGMPDPERAWRAAALLDGMAHRERLSRLPVLLTSGSEDTLCPPRTIQALFDALTGTKAYMNIKGSGHCYTQEFVYMAMAWLRMYA